MRMFKDILTGDEMFTDAYPMEEIAGFMYKVKGKFVTEKNDVEVNTGSNPSAEEAAEQLEEGAVQKGVDVVLASKLRETVFTKKTYKIHVASYMKKIVAKLPEDKKAEFKAKAQDHVKFVLENFKDCEFFFGEDLDEESQAAMVHWEGGDSPYVYFYKDGLDVEKL